MKKDRQLVILLAALLVLIFLSSCAAGKNASMTPTAPDFAYAEDDSYTRDAPAEAPQAEAPMANEYKAEIGGAMGEMSFDDTAEAEEAPTGSPESQGSAADITEKIIYSANVSIETTDFAASVSGLEQNLRGRSARSEASWKTPTFPAIRAGTRMERPPLSTAGPITHSGSPQRNLSIFSS